MFNATQGFGANFPNGMFVMPHPQMQQQLQQQMMLLQQQQVFSQTLAHVCACVAVCCSVCCSVLQCWSFADTCAGVCVCSTLQNFPSVEFSASHRRSRSFVCKGKSLQESNIIGCIVLYDTQKKMKKKVCNEFVRECGHFFAQTSKTDLLFAPKK